MEEPDKDSWAITEMELEYVRIISTCEDQCRVDHGDIPTYHAIRSPPGAGEDNNGMLEGSTAEVLPATEAALL